MDKPECGPRDVIMKTVRSGICGSDVSGIGIDKDAEYGHETAGYLTEVGSEVKSLDVGNRVFINPMEACPTGRSMMLGGFSEYIRVPDAELGKSIYLLPDGLSYDEAALIEPFAVGTHGKNVPNAKPGDHVVVYGVGTIGLSCISGLCAQGINPVAIVRNDTKRALLEKMGAVVCNISEVDEFEFLKEVFGESTGRVGFPVLDIDIVVDCAGAPNIVDDFLRMQKRFSQLSVVGVNMNPTPVPLVQVMSSEVIIRGSCAYDDADIREVIDNLASGRTYMKEIITHHYKLDDIQEALTMAADRKQAIKVVIDME
ncbi:MAG: zinc-binding dehydrogenase [Clostridiales Family XIII bacterium]|nr:zinc-binding dehydrogenase [Clostridiales Family XIII bacterium]